MMAQVRHLKNSTRVKCDPALKSFQTTIEAQNKKAIAVSQSLVLCSCSTVVKLSRPGDVYNFIKHLACKKCNADHEAPEEVFYLISKRKD